MNKGKPLSDGVKPGTDKRTSNIRLYMTMMTNGLFGL